MSAPRGRGRAVSIAFDAAARKVGMAKAKLRHMGSPYVMGDGDSFPVFYPKYIGRWGGTQIVGGIGLYVRPFESWWADLVDMFNKTTRDQGPVIGIYILNFRSMMGAPALLASETAEIEEWAAKIASLARQIFPPERDIFDIICSEDLAGLGLREYIWPSVKTYAFNIWLHLQRPDIKVPIDLKLLDELDISRREPEYEFLNANYGDIDP